GDPPTLPTFSDVIAMGIDGARHYVGRYQGIDCIALRVAADVAESEGWQWRGLRSLFLQIPDPLLALAGRSSQVVEWDRSHRYCGRCGTPTLDKPDERAKQCPACGHVVYPRVSPAMMVLVSRGRELLFDRRAAAASVAGQYFTQADRRDGDAAGPDSGATPLAMPGVKKLR